MTYRMYYLPKMDVSEALRSYQARYGTPPSEILINPKQVEPMPGFNLVVRADPVILLNHVWLGEVPDEQENSQVCVDVEDE